MIKKIECKPNTFTTMQIVKNLYFLLNQHNDLILWDDQLIPKHKIHLDYKVVKMLANDTHVYILYENGKLERFNLETS